MEERNGRKRRVFFFFFGILSSFFFPETKQGRDGGVIGGSSCFLGDWPGEMGHGTFLSARELVAGEPVRTGPACLPACLSLGEQAKGKAFFEEARLN